MAKQKQKQKKKQQMSDKEFKRTHAQFCAEMKAAANSPAGYAWIADLPEGEDFDDSDEDSTTVIIHD
jgi:hypothetical protein